MFSLFSKQIITILSISINYGYFQSASNCQNHGLYFINKVHVKTYTRSSRPVAAPQFSLFAWTSAWTFFVKRSMSTKCAYCQCNPVLIPILMGCDTMYKPPLYALLWKSRVMLGVEKLKKRYWWMKIGKNRERTVCFFKPFYTRFQNKFSREFHHHLTPRCQQQIYASDLDPGWKIIKP